MNSNDEIVALRVPLKIILLSSLFSINRIRCCKLFLEYLRVARRQRTYRDQINGEGLNVIIFGSRYFLKEKLCSLVL